MPDCCEEGGLEERFGESERERRRWRLVGAPRTGGGDRRSPCRHEAGGTKVALQGEKGGNIGWGRPVESSEDNKKDSVQATSVKTAVLLKGSEKSLLKGDRGFKELCKKLD